MKIGYDAKRLFFNHSGLGNYSRSVVKHYHQLFSEDQISLFGQKIHKSLFKDEFTSADYDIVDGKNKLLWRMKFIVNDIRNRNLDFYHGLSNELPLGIGEIKSLKKVVTIHDLIFLRYPEFYPFLDRKIYNEKFRRSCYTADKIIAVSESTKNDIVEFYGVSESKIETIYQSCDEIFFIKENDWPFPKVIRKEQRPYFLFVSSISHRKNLKNVLIALEQIKSENRPRLIIVGNGGNHKTELETWVKEKNISKDVVFLGQIKNQDLRDLYFHAKFSIYPSFYEGFGIPIIESLLCGTPVITSNISSMPEAGQGMSILIDPHSIEDMKAAIVKLSISAEKVNEDKIDKIKRKFSAEGHVTKLNDLYKNLH